MKEITIKEFIEKFGVSKALLIFGDKIGEEVMKNFTFRGWKEVYHSSRVQENPSLEKKAVEGMFCTASTFNEYMFVYIETDDALSEAAYTKAFSKEVTVEEWVEWYEVNNMFNFKNPAKTKKQEKVMDQFNAVMNKYVIFE